MAEYRPRPVSPRRTKNRVFHALCLLAASLAVAILVVLLASILVRGLPQLDWQFLTSPPSANPADAGIWTALVGTVIALLIVTVTAIPIGVATAILLEEYKPQNPILARIHGFIQLNITNLAGVPSIVYGILGVTVFASFFYLAKPKFLGGEESGPWLTFGEQTFLEYPGLGGGFYYVDADGLRGQPEPSADY